MSIAVLVTVPFVVILDSDVLVAQVAVAFDGRPVGVIAVLAAEVLADLTAAEPAESSVVAFVEVDAA